MTNSNTRGFALLTFALLALPVLIVVAPSGAARAPEAIYDAPESVGLEISDIALDAQGRYAAVVVKADLASTSLLTPLPSDVFVFDIEHGTKLWSERHDAAARTGQLVNNQVVAFAETTGQTVSEKGRFYVGGPGNAISGWVVTSASEVFDRKADTSGTTAAVATSGKGDYVAFGINTPGGRGTVTSTSSDGKVRWSLNLTGPSSTETAVTEMAMTRSASLLIVGHEAGVTFLDPRSATAPTGDAVQTRLTEGAVTAIDVSHDGRYAVLGDADGYVYLWDLESDRTTSYNRGLGSPIRDVAITGTGQYFVAGTANGKVHFFERSADPTIIAQKRADPVTSASEFTFQTGRAIVSVDYDASGDTLVVATDGELAGFHGSRNEPVWRVLAGSAGLPVSVPLKGARVADSGERILVAGFDKITALRQVFGAEVTVPQLKTTAVPGDTVRYDVSVRNSGSAVDSFTVRVTPPAGWESDAIRTLTLRPEEVVDLEVNLTSPPGAAPGSRNVELLVESKALKDRARDATVGKFTLNVTITRVPNIRIEADTTEHVIDQGDELPVAFTVKNLGNADAVVNFSAIQNPSVGSSWTVRFEPQQLPLPAGGSSVVTMHARAPVDASDGDLNRVTIRASVGTTHQRDFDVRLRVNPEYGMTVEANTTDVAVKRGKSATVKITLKNVGNTPDTVNLSAIVNPPSARTEWRADLDYKVVEVAAGASRDVTVTIRSTTREPEPASVTIGTITLLGKETQEITIQLEQEEEAETSGGFLGIPATPAPAVLLALLGAAAAVAVAGRGRQSR